MWVNYKKSGSYQKRKGSNYERKIAKELRDLGYEGVVTTRSESKNMDDNKIDLVDINNELPCHIQLKKTMNTPNYYTIKSQCKYTDKPFIIIWDKQIKKEVNFTSEGELVLIPKDFFYSLIKK